MNQATAEQIAKKAAEEAVKAFNDEARKKSHAKIFQNTRYLMENYNRIKGSIEEGVSEASDLAEDEFNEQYGYLDELFIESIRKGKIRSVIMLAHIDRCLKLLEAEEERKNTYEKYLAFKYYFLDGMTYENIAEVYGYNERTVRRWSTELISILGVYLFGVDGLRL